MKYIANILTDKKFSDNELYNVVKTKEGLIDGIPTLSIGWEFTKTMYPTANIIDWKIDENTFWTFGNRERRDRYEESIKKFRNFATNRLIKDVKYNFFSVLIASENEKRHFFDKMKDFPTTIYINGDMVYVFSEENNVVVGLSLQDLDYEGMERKKMFSFFYKHSNINIVDGHSLSWETKNSLKNCNYIIPYLYS